MFDFVRNHTRLFQGILVLLIFPSFVFFGVQGYSRFTGEAEARVASVDGQGITRAEWDATTQRQIERMRQQMPGVDIKLFDTPQLRAEVLDGLVRERVLAAAAAHGNLRVSDAELQRTFAEDPQLAPLRNPDGSVNRDLLAAQGMSSEMFAEQLRMEIGMTQVLAGLAGSATAPKSAVRTAVDAVMQRREVQGQRFDAKAYEAKVAPTEADIEAWYKANQESLRLPEQAEVEYVVLDLDGLMKSVSVSEDDLRKYHAENASRYTAAEERRASHILIKADKSAPAPQRQQAKAKAEELLAQVRKAPATFPEVARAQSQDPGSASRGGDLDFFGRGAMVKPFEDAVFAMKPGEISPVIESDFGYHVIRLEAVRGGEKKSFESMRAEIEAEVRRQLAQRKYAESAEQFTNTVYEQSDSLQPVLEKFKLEKRTATVRRTPVPGTSGVFANAKLLEAIFSTDAIANKRNTDAVDVGNSQLVSARVVNHQPARVPQLAEVREKAREGVVRQQAAALARKDGEALLAKLRQAPDTALPDARVVSRAPGDLPREVTDAVLSADTAKLPVALGVSLGDRGYWVGKVLKVLPPEDTILADPNLAQQYARAWAAAEGAAYYESLKKRHRVTIRAAAAAASAAAP
jgi:peptidyl-prolyl cis-trans isomerase D